MKKALTAAAFAVAALVLVWTASACGGGPEKIQRFRVVEVEGITCIVLSGFGGDVGGISCDWR